MNIIQQIEKARMTREVPDFNPGDTVVVQVKVVEGDRERVQAYEGVVIAKKNRGLNSSFAVRDLAHREGRVEAAVLLGDDHALVGLHALAITLDQRSEREAPRCRAPRQALL